MYQAAQHITSTVMRLELDKLGVKVIDAELGEWIVAALQY
jgi:hypothetical protein